MVGVKCFHDRPTERVMEKMQMKEHQRGSAGVQRVTREHGTCEGCRLWPSAQHLYNLKNLGPSYSFTFDFHCSLYVRCWFYLLCMTALVSSQVSKKKFLIWAWSHLINWPSEAQQFKSRPWKDGIINLQICDSAANHQNKTFSICQYFSDILTSSGSFVRWNIRSSSTNCTDWHTLQCQQKGLSAFTH